MTVKVPAYPSGTEQLYVVSEPLGVATVQLAPAMDPETLKVVSELLLLPLATTPEIVENPEPEPLRDMLMLSAFRTPERWSSLSIPTTAS